MLARFRALLSSLRNPVDTAIGQIMRRLFTVQSVSPATARLSIQSTKQDTGVMTKVIMNRSVCSINFELFFADGTAVDSNKDLDPVIIEIGDGILLPKLEEALQGLAEGCTREVKLTPEHAYGFANPNEFFEFPVAQLPDEARQVGASVMAEDENGEQKVVLVSELKGDKAVLDFNHPYAGRTLIYKIELLAIAEA